MITTVAVVVIVAIGIVASDTECPQGPIEITVALVTITTTTKQRNLASILLLTSVE